MQLLDDVISDKAKSYFLHLFVHFVLNFITFPVGDGSDGLCSGQTFVSAQAVLSVSTWTVHGPEKHKISLFDKLKVHNIYSCVVDTVVSVFVFEAVREEVSIAAL